MDAEIALKQFEYSNQIKEIQPVNQIFTYDSEAQQKQIKEQPWKKEYVHRLE
jgi:hypothetical protein